MCTIIEKTVLGWVGISSSINGITGVILPRETRQEVVDLIGEASSEADSLGISHLKEAASRLAKFFRGRDVKFPDKLDYSGATELQRKVWEETRRIPYGKTSTYGQIARKIGCRSPRAVGQALGRNPFPVIIPCHRVIGSDGRLVGFGGGLKLKKQMLEMEKSI